MEWHGDGRVAACRERRSPRTKPRTDTRRRLTDRNRNAGPYVMPRYKRLVAHCESLEGLCAAPPGSEDYECWLAGAIAGESCAAPSGDFVLTDRVESRLERTRTSVTRQRGRAGEGKRRRDGLEFSREGWKGNYAHACAGALQPHAASARPALSPVLLRAHFC